MNPHRPAAGARPSRRKPRVSSPVMRARARQVVEPAQALALAARYAGTHARSTQEVFAYLQRRRASAAAARAAIATCQARGLLDDPLSAQLWAEQWARQGFAWGAIRARLSAKGFGDDAIARAARHVGTASMDDARARLVVASSLQRTRRVTSRADLSRTLVQARQRAALGRRLAARGFDSDTIERVLGAGEEWPERSHI